MQTLYPIIRRKRRPLLVAESVPDEPPGPSVVVGNVEPVNAVAVKPVETVVTESEPQATDDQDASSVES